MNHTTTMNKKSVKLPHTLVLIYLIVLIVYALAWILPSGSFQRIGKTVAGTARQVTVPGTFTYMPKETLSPAILLTAPVRGFQDGALIIAFLFIIGGAFTVIQETGTIDQAIRRLAATFARRPALRGLVIPVLMTVFSLAGSIFGMCEETIPFIVVFIPLALSMGYDSIVGVAIPFLGAAAGFAAAFFNPFTVGIAQGLSDLPLYSGLSYRLLSWVLGTGLMITMVMLYAARIRRNPAASPVYEIDRQRLKTDQPDNASATAELTSRHRLVLWIFGGGILILVAGILLQHWYIEAIAAVFLGMGLAAGFAGGIAPSRMAAHFITGARDMMNVAFIIACGRAILIVAQEGQILDTMLYYASQFISIFPRIVTAQMMFLTQSFINFFIHSGTAQAALTMPIMAPLSDLVGVTRQTTVYAFQLCEFVNPILPTSAVTMGVLGIAGIPWEKWARWFLPIMLVLIGFSLIMLVPPVLMNWGPF
ncbi:MAG: hypothetical protein RB296_03360 [Acidobacteriota bacterium]|jgi:uncharacterized ion transporter superfamily protein YfcC|nr:hypothetical protein [Acidobacteriota bacterium]